MGEDYDFVRQLLDTYKVSASMIVKQTNLEALRDELDTYDLSPEERAEIKRAINNELEGMGVSPVEEAVSEVSIMSMEERRKIRPLALEREEIEVGYGKQYYCVDDESFLCGKCALEHWDKGHVIVEEYDYYGEGEIEKFWCEDCDVKEEKEKLMGGQQEPKKGKEGEEIKVNPEAKLIELIIHFNPDGLAEALEEALPEEKRLFFADLIRKRLEESAEIEAIDWATNVAEWHKGCEEAMGIPMYRTRYIERFEDPGYRGKYMVLAICYSPRKRPHKSQFFNNVPLEDIERLERD